jgi:dATP pyrophosphohydrolase
MARAPLNVLVLLFRRTAEGPEFAVLRRADEAGDVWQGVAGGAEDDESPLEAARREFFEETGVSAERLWVGLQARCSVPAVVFAAWKDWPPDLYVVEEHAFAVELAADDAIVLSKEHAEVRWLPYEDAHALLRWDSNRTALWELNARLTGAR